MRKLYAAEQQRAGPGPGQDAGGLLEAASAGTLLPAGLELPDDETLEPITDAVRALSGVLASGERLGGPAA